MKFRSPSVPATSEDRDDLAHLGRVVSVRAIIEIAAEQGDRIAEPPHPTEQEAPIPTVLGIGRLDHGQEIDGPERRRALSAAKVVIGQAGRFVGQQAVQLHGGMGVSDELPVSHCFKRLLAIELSLGDTEHHLERFIAAGRAGAT